MGITGDNRPANFINSLTLLYRGRIKWGNLPKSRETSLLPFVRDRGRACILPADNVLRNYLAEVTRVGLTGAGTGEISYYGALRRALVSVGTALRPAAYALGQLSGGPAGIGMVRRLADGRYGGVRPFLTERQGNLTTSARSPANFIVIVAAGLLSSCGSPAPATSVKADLAYAQTTLDGTKRVCRDGPEGGPYVPPPPSEADRAKAEWDIAAAQNLDSVSTEQEWEIRASLGAEMGLAPSQVNGWRQIYRARAETAQKKLAVSKQPSQAEVIAL